MELIIFIMIAGALYFFTHKPKPKPIVYSTITTIDTADYTYKPNTRTKETMQALVFIGKADGQLRDNECSVIADYLIEMQPEHISTPKTYIISKIRDMKPPKSAEYKKFIANITDTERNTFIRYAKNIIGTQKSIHPFEEYLLEELNA